MTSMNFPTVPYDHVTNSFLLELWFWSPTYPSFSDKITLFLFNSFIPYVILQISISISFILIIGKVT